MTNDEYSAIERKLGLGQPLTNDEGKLVVEQLKTNAGRYIALEKRLSDEVHRLTQQMRHGVVLSGETLFNITGVRDNGAYGAECVVDGQLLCIAPQFSTMTGLFHALHAKLAEAILRSRHQRAQPGWDANGSEVRR